MIWVHNMKQVDYIAEWHDPCGGEDTKAMQVLAGNQWNEVY